MSFEVPRLLRSCGLSRLLVYGTSNRRQALAGRCSWKKHLVHDHLQPGATYAGIHVSHRVSDVSPLVKLNFDVCVFGILLSGQDCLSLRNSLHREDENNQ